MSAALSVNGGAMSFRDPARGRALAARIAAVMDDIGRPVSLMHVCGSHEQAIARYGIRAVLPPSLDVYMGPGCPVCVTDQPEVDEGVALAEAGIRVATYGDMLRVPGSRKSLADARAEGARVESVYSITQAVDLARKTSDEVVFFATGFETTAVTTAAVLDGELPSNFSVLSAHKYIPPAMELVARMPGTRVEGFLAAGHAAAITGSAIFDDLATRHALPIVIAGFEPLDVLAALLRLVELVRDRRPVALNMYPRCVTPEGNRNAEARLWKVFERTSGWWRGIALVEGGNLRLRDAYAHVDARRRFSIRTAPSVAAPASLTTECRCGDIMAGFATPADCQHFGGACRPDTPVGACMVSTEGSCHIWYQYGGRPDLSSVGISCPNPNWRGGGPCP